MLLDPKWNDTLTALEKPKPQQPPKFSAWRWHSWSRLDIRPLLWSLRNRPEEWAVSGSEEVPRLRHKPSAHEFYYDFVLCGIAYSNGCSCRHEDRRTFSWTQTFQFRRAAKPFLKARRQNTLREVNKQFAAHFLPDADVA